MKATALRAEIFKHMSGDCSNHGISSRFTDILILCDHGNEIIDMDNPPENLCKVVTRTLWGREYKHVEPMARPTGVGWMSGGCVVYSCDSRFGELTQYPLVLHDRQETQEEYNTYD
jgi:hypothetical protein